MPIIKDQQISDNAWSFVADDAPLTDGNVTVTLNRWQTEKQALLQHSGSIGIRLSPADSVEAISNDLASFKLIELYFPVFTDGRSFSQARLLRARYGYQCEIRAVGHYMTDQEFYLKRVGVDAFELNNPKEIEHAQAALNDFSVRYQASSL